MFNVECRFRFEKIAIAANRDLRRAILLFETSFVGGLIQILRLYHKFGFEAFECLMFSFSSKIVN